MPKNGTFQSFLRFAAIAVQYSENTKHSVFGEILFIAVFTSSDQKLIKHYRYT